MYVYFAGATRVEEGFPELQHEVKRRLVSYHYQTKSLDEFYYINERDKYDSIILDSGAFSAWSQKAIIDIDKYAEYALKWQDKVNYIVNLDVIPASPGVKPSAEEIERSASLGYENYRYLLNKGILKDKLIHVFHQHENYKWLHKMVHEDKMPYIGLSPANDQMVKQKMQFLDSCMPYVTDSTGKALVKFHGFAVTSYALMRRYPWFSVDSSTWAVAGGRGEVFIPYERDDGSYDFSKAPRKLMISQIGGKPDHYKNLQDQYKNKSDSVIKSTKSIREHSISKYLAFVNVKEGAQRFSREHKDYVLDKENGEKFCSNSFVVNMKWENHHEKSSGILSKEQFESADINHTDITINYDGPDFKWVEHIKEKGMTNYWKERQRLNAIFVNKFVYLLHEKEPRVFNQDGKHTNGFGF